MAAGINRVTPLLSGLTDYQINGGDVRTSQEGFGPETPIGVNAKTIQYIFNEGGLCLYKQLKKLNGRQMRVFPVDTDRVAYGTVINENGTDKFRGFSATVWVTRRDNNGSQGGAILLSVYYGSDYDNEDTNMASVALTEAYEGLTGVVLMKTGSGMAKFVIACSGDDLTETYSNDLADKALYKDTAGANPTSVSYNNGELTFAPIGRYRILDAAALDGAGIEGLEGEDVYTNLT
jgi:hypothetical protein